MNKFYLLLLFLCIDLTLKDLNSLKINFQDIIIEEKLGEGAFGIVNKSQWKVITFQYIFQ